MRRPGATREKPGCPGWYRWHRCSGPIPQGPGISRPERRRHRRNRGTRGRGWRYRRNGHARCRWFECRHCWRYQRLRVGLHQRRRGPFRAECAGQRKWRSFRLGQTGDRTSGFHRCIGIATRAGGTRHHDPQCTRRAYHAFAERRQSDPGYGPFGRHQSEYENRWARSGAGPNGQDQRTYRRKRHPARNTDSIQSRLAEVQPARSGYPGQDSRHRVGQRAGLVGGARQGELERQGIGAVNGDA